MCCKKTFFGLGEIQSLQDRELRVQNRSIGRGASGLADSDAPLVFFWMPQ
jgi:hypothetical protein